MLKACGLPFCIQHAIHDPSPFRGHCGDVQGPTEDPDTTGAAKRDDADAEMFVLFEGQKLHVRQQLF